MADSTAIPRDLLSVGQAARLLGVSIQTVRNYCERGELEVFRIGSGSHRRISKGEVINYLHGGCLDAPTGKILGYARTSSAKQKEDLVRQIERLKTYAEGKYKGAEFVLFQDNASSMNWNRAGLNKLLCEVMAGQHKGATLLITHQDRLGRHCRPLLELICKQFEINILYTEQDDEASLEAMMTEELLQIVHLYSIRMYGRRSADRTKLVPEAKAVIRGKELKAMGASRDLILTTLKSEGFKCENGKEITRNSVSKYIFNPKTALKIQTIALETSGEEFKRAFARRVSKLHRTPFREVYDFYRRWCRENNKVVLSSTIFSRIMARDYERKFYGPMTAYVGLEIKGAHLHKMVRRRQTNHTPETKSELFERFIESLGNYRGRRDDIHPLYNAFCEKEGMELVGQKEIDKLLRQARVRHVQGRGSRIYIVGNDPLQQHTSLA